MESVIPEVSAPTKQCPNPGRWRCYDGEATEVEVLELLYALVLALKPNVILETGCYRGFGTEQLAWACSDNGFGHVWSCDLDEQRVTETRQRLAPFASYATVQQMTGVELIRSLPVIDFAFLDSGMTVRVQEAEALLPRLSPGGLVVVHDTSVLHAELHNGPRIGLDELARKYDLRLIHCNTPRGVSLLSK